MLLRGTRALKVLTGCAVGAALLAGCGSSTTSSSPTSSVQSLARRGATSAQSLGVTLQRAAYVSSEAPGFKDLFSIQETTPGASLTVSGSGSFTVANHDASMTMQANIPGVGNLQFQVVTAHQTFYMKFPPQLADKLPAGKLWAGAGLSQASKKAGMPGLSSLYNGSFSLDNPGQYLDFLRATASGSVNDLGAATVNGVQTTHYHAIVDLTKLPDAVPAGTRAAANQLVAQLHRQGGASTIPVDVWIDSSHLIRRVVLSLSQPIATTGQTVDLTAREDFVQYGPQPAPAVPPASQTTNLLALTHGKAA